MATYDFTNSWDTGTYVKDDYTYTFPTTPGGDFIQQSLAETTFATNGYDEGGYLAPGAGGNHGSDLQASFGSDYGSGGVDLLNYVDFDYSDDGSSEWSAMMTFLAILIRSVVLQLQLMLKAGDLFQLNQILMDTVLFHPVMKVIR